MSPSEARPRIVMTRSYAASVAELWALWTTKEGIESWWGPDGFTVTVESLDLRPGGEWRYLMTATAPEQVAFMKQAGLPLSTPACNVYREVVAHERLSYVSLADFIPGVAPYEVGTTVSFQAEGEGVRMRLVFDAMHDAHWTEMATMGHEGQLAKLAALLAARHQA